MNDYHLFIVDDEETIRDGITFSLAGEGYRVDAFASAEQALVRLPQEKPDLVLLDVGLPGMNGIEALAAFRELEPDLLVVMITAYEDADTIIAAMKLGAHDYVVKPLHMERLRVTIDNALETIRLRKEVQSLQARFLEERMPLFVGESEAIQEVMEFIGKIAKSPDTPILILGETGTGKELIASTIHYRSPHFNGPLVSVNCAAIPRDLIESELFGYERGAFSGADAAGKKGLIEEADGGTLFLDEVGDLSLEAQAKLLRFLESGEFYRVGSTRRVRIATRVISATNKDIPTMLEDGSFRRDLYFRLGVIRLQIPSLNDRKADIMPIARYFLHQFNKKFEKNFTGFSREAEKALLRHRWTGNVRELKNMIERAALTGQHNNITVQDLWHFQPSAPGPDLPSVTAALPALDAAGIELETVRQEIEKKYFREAMELAAGNESQAARLLGLNHHTFRYRRRKLFGDESR